MRLLMMLRCDRLRLSVIAEKADSERHCSRGILPVGGSVTRDFFSKGGKFLLKRGKKRWKIFFAQRWKIKVENKGGKSHKKS